MKKKTLNAIDKVAKDYQKQKGEVIDTMEMICVDNKLSLDEKIELLKMLSPRNIIKWLTDSKPL